MTLIRDTYELHKWKIVFILLIFLVSLVYLYFWVERYKSISSAAQRDVYAIYYSLFNYYRTHDASFCNLINSVDAVVSSEDETRIGPYETPWGGAYQIYIDQKNAKVIIPAIPQYVVDDLLKGLKDTYKQEMILLSCNNNEVELSLKFPSQYDLERRNPTPFSFAQVRSSPLLKKQDLVIRVPLVTRRVVADTFELSWQPQAPASIARPN